ncbi:hypothetical protein KIPB_014309, partial [Kipferlia bialata]|eukprot:g14309.t1
MTTCTVSPTVVYGGSDPPDPPESALGSKSDMVMLLETILSSPSLLEACGGEDRIESLLSAVLRERLFVRQEEFK